MLDKYFEVGTYRLADRQLVRYSDDILGSKFRMPCVNPETEQTISVCLGQSKGNHVRLQKMVKVKCDCVAVHCRNMASIADDMDWLSEKRDRENLSRVAEELPAPIRLCKVVL